MDKELKQKAEAEADKVIIGSGMDRASVIHLKHLLTTLYIQGYHAGAEPREKRIAELERKLEQTEKDLADYQFNYPTIKELQKENAELKEKLNMYKHDCPNCSAFGKHCPHKVNGDPYYYDCAMTVEELEKENAELKARVSEQSERISELTQDLDDNINRFE